MSVAFASSRPRSKGEVTQQTIQKMLDENHHLIQCIMDYQSKGKTAECTQYQQILHRNLVYLATIADSNQNMQSLLPAPPSQNMNMGAAGMGQNGGSQSMHSQSNLNDNMSSAIPPASHMQGQISNGPSHTPMQSSGPATAPPTSMSTPVSSHGSASGYSHTVTSQGVSMQGQSQATGGYTSRTNHSLPASQVTMMHQQAGSTHYASGQGSSQHYQSSQSMGMMGQSNQGNSMISQRPMGSYRTPQQGSTLQYTGQDEFYSEQYGHSQSSSEPLNQQYYPDGHGDYSYQQSSYSEPAYERSFDESSQHYFEGGRAGNSTQYSGQQSSYQQSSGQQQPFSQQQYPAQPSYSGQQQAYAPGQGASSQYSGYQQSQGQQYSSYRPAQGPPSGQSQRPYAYEQQGQYGSYQQ